MASMYLTNIQFFVKEVYKKASSNYYLKRFLLFINYSRTSTELYPMSLAYEFFVWIFIRS